MMRLRLALGLLVLGCALLAACTSAGAPPHSGGDVASGSSSGGVVRTYFISADPVVWDYAPTGRNQIEDRRFSADENVFVGSGPDRIGSRYLKCLYRGYTPTRGSRAESVRTPRTPTWGTSAR